MVCPSAVISEQGALVLFGAKSPCFSRPGERLDRGGSMRRCPHLILPLLAVFKVTFIEKSDSRTI